MAQLAGSNTSTRLFILLEDGQPARPLRVHLIIGAGVFHSSALARSLGHLVGHARLLHTVCNMSPRRLGILGNYVPAVHCLVFKY